MSELVNRLRDGRWLTDPAVCQELAHAVLQTGEDAWKPGEGMQGYLCLPERPGGGLTRPGWLIEGVVRSLPDLRQILEDAPRMGRFLNRRRGFFGAISTGDEPAEPEEEDYPATVLADRSVAVQRFASHFEGGWRRLLVDQGLLDPADADPLARTWVQVSFRFLAWGDRPYREECSLAFLEGALFGRLKPVEPAYVAHDWNRALDRAGSLLDEGALTREDLLRLRFVDLDRIRSWSPEASAAAEVDA